MGNKTLGYRPELDGLRAVAVVSVLLYHLGSPFSPGGFVGVDVFFVLSGFLITRLIAEELRVGEFRLSKFYERRIRRIVPALLVVCACCTVAAVIVLLPDELKRFSSSLIVAASVSNFWFLRQSNYFSPAVETQPLYLWHWPLIVFTRLWVARPLSLTLQIILTCLALGLAIVTWRFVETPFRRRDGRRLSPKAIYVAGGVGLGSLVVCGLIVVGLRGLPGRIPKDALALAAASSDSSPMRSKCHFDGALNQTYDMSCVFGAPVEPDFIVYADSHGAELSLVLGKLAEERGQSVRELTASGCAPTLNLLPEDEPECVAYNARMLKKLTSIPPTTIIVTANAAAWSSEDAAIYIPGMQKVVHALRDAGHRVIILGSVPVHPNSVPIPATLASRVMLGQRSDGYTFDPGMANYRDIEMALEKVATAEHAEYVPVSPLLCDKVGCKADIDGTVLYFDHGHLSVAGAKLVATKVLAPILWPPAAVVQVPSELQNQVAQ